LVTVDLLFWLKFAATLAISNRYFVSSDFEGSDMPKIDLNRLRRFHTDAEAAHAALMRQWDKVRKAREDLACARTQLASSKQPVPGVRKHDPNAEKPFRAAVEVAEATLQRAEEESARLSQIWEHAARLKTRVREYAIQQGALPADLQEV
jgi:hypothetical protein